jgi:hypothetical protein
MCYEPTMLGWQIQQTRGSIDLRLTLLKQIAKRGSLKEETLKSIEKNLLKEWEFVLRGEELWMKPRRKTTGESRDTDELLMSYFVDQPDDTIEIDDRLEVREHLTVTCPL